MTEFLTDLRRAVRSLARNPGYSLAVILMLALGLGLCSYMFTALNAYVLRPLPVPEPEELVHLETRNLRAGADSIAVSPHDFADWRVAQRSFESLQAFTQGTVNLTDAGRPERYEGAFLTAGAFEVIGARALLGRGFAAGDDQVGAPPVAVLSHQVWMARYGGDPTVIGRAVRVNGKPGTIVGVMPEGFRFPYNEQVWVPLQIDLAGERRGQGGSLEVFGRLRDGVTLEQARADLTAISADLERRYPQSNRGLEPVLKPYAHEYVGPQTRAILGAMNGAVLLVLLIACANVANLVLARAAARARELAIRSALGAGRLRLARQLTAETVVLCLAGGILGFAAACRGASYTFAALKASSEDVPPFGTDFAIDWRDAAYLALAVALAVLCAGLVPALRALRGDLVTPIKAGGHGSTVGRSGRPRRLSGALVAAQVALCCVLLGGAGLMVRSILNIHRVELGADPAGLLSGRIALFEEVYPEPESRVRFFDQLAERLRALPDVAAVAVGTSVPGAFINSSFYQRPDQPVEPDQRLPVTAWAAVGPGYFETLRIPLAGGREFTAADRAGAAAVAVVNRRFASRVWPDADPIGQRLLLGEREEATEATVVGLVGDVLHGMPEDGIRPVVYQPLAQVAPRFASVALRVRDGDPRALAEPLRRETAALDPDLPVYFVRTVDEWVRLNTFGSFLVARLFVIFGAAGFALAGIGLYAVLAYGVAQRTREIGVRRALGALDRGIVRLVLRQGMTQTLIGAALGLPLAIGFGKVLSGELVGVEAFDPLTLVAVAILVGLVTALAALVPLRRALRVDPLQALRQE